MTEEAPAERVVLVGERGEPIGSAGKLDAHRPPGMLHLAFSVFVFDRRGRVLLQQRAAGKYHFAGRWSNTACGHPRPGETLVAAATRRLVEEMGIDAELSEVGHFRYRAVDPASHLVENELDHVLVGCTDAEPRPDPDEVGDWRWVGVAELRSDLGAHAERYSPWLRQALDVAAPRAS
jgi:isopentenyl-diphosphate delta-isomerase